MLTLPFISMSKYTSFGVLKVEQNAKKFSDDIIARQVGHLFSDWLLKIRLEVRIFESGIEINQADI